MNWIILALACFIFSFVMHFCIALYNGLYLYSISSKIKVFLMILFQTLMMVFIVFITALGAGRI